MRRYGRFTVELPDEKFVWEPDEVTLGEQLMLETEHGGSYTQWIVAVGEERALACQLLIWFLRRKDGRQEDRQSVTFPVRYLDITIIPDDDEDDPDPEAPAPSEGATSNEPAGSSA